MSVSRSAASGIQTTTAMHFECGWFPEHVVVDVDANSVEAEEHKQRTEHFDIVYCAQNIPLHHS